jgi:hypothetical protein
MRGLKEYFGVKIDADLPEKRRWCEKSRSGLHIMQVQRLFVSILRGRSQDHLRHASFGTKRNLGRF